MIADSESFRGHRCFKKKWAGFDSTKPISRHCVSKHAFVGVHLLGTRAVPPPYFSIHPGNRSSLRISYRHTAAERFVNSHQSCDRSRLTGREAVLRFEERALGVEHAEKVSRASFETLTCEIGSLLARLGRYFQESLSRLLVSEIDQRAFRLLEGGDHGTFVEG